MRLITNFVTRAEHPLKVCLVYLMCAVCVFCEDMTTTMVMMMMDDFPPSCELSATSQGFAFCNDRPKIHVNHYIQ